MVLLVIFSAVSAVYSAADQPVIREQQKLIVDGVEETWRLEWAEKPTPACSPDEPDWYTCPCMGFAFGETGSLSLVRSRPGHKEERLQLDQYFSINDFAPASSGDGKAVLQRWKPAQNDMDNQEKPEFATRVSSRPVVRIINLADYDHDGRSTEFLLQIATMPCGKRMNIAVGISRKNPRLHPIVSRLSPDRPLMLQAHQWDALKKATGPAKVIDWQCGDHGAENEEELELLAKDGLISATRHKFTCNEQGKRTGKPISSKSF